VSENLAKDFVPAKFLLISAVASNNMAKYYSPIVLGVDPVKFGWVVNCVIRFLTGHPNFSSVNLAQSPADESFSPMSTCALSAQNRTKSHASKWPRWLKQPSSVNVAGNLSGSEYDCRDGE